MGMERVIISLVWLGTVAASGVTAQECTDGRASRPTLGIGTYYCQGGACLVSGSSATVKSELPSEMQRFRQNHRFAYSFSVVPSLWRIDRDGPAIGKLQAGDELVGVNGAPITTHRAAMYLTRMEAGTPLELNVKRDGRLIRIDVTPELRCGPIRASAGPGERPGSIDRPERQPIPPEIGEDAPLVRLPGLGLTLLGAKVIDVASDGTMRWWFAAVPTVAEVDEGGAADHAGILPGEELALAGDAWVTSEEGVAALLAADRGEETTLVVRFDNRARGVRVGR